MFSVLVKYPRIFRLLRSFLLKILRPQKKYFYRRRIRRRGASWVKGGRGIPLAPKNHYSLGIGLMLYKSKGCNVKLMHQRKWGIPNNVSWGAKVLKSFCAPLVTKFTYKKRSGGKTGMWGRGLAKNTYTVVYKNNLLGCKNYTRLSLRSYYYYMWLLGTVQYSQKNVVRSNNILDLHTSMTILST